MVADSKVFFCFFGFVLFFPAVLRKYQGCVLYRQIRRLSKKFVEFVNKNKITIPITLKFVYD